MWSWFSAFFRWPFDHANEDIVAGWGFWLTVVGFVITWVQLWRTRSAAKAAQKAANDVRLSVAHYDAAHDISEAQYALGVTMDHITGGSWDNAIKSYEDVRRAMLRLRVFIADDVDQDTLTEIDQMTTKIARFCKAVDLSISGSGAMPNAANVKDNLRKNVRSSA